MTSRVISTVIDWRWVSKVGKYVVTLAFPDEKAEDVWMTEKQLSQILICFGGTPKGHSRKRSYVTGFWNEKGYYAYARHTKVTFVLPPQYDLSDLEDAEQEETQ